MAKESPRQQLQDATCDDFERFRSSVLAESQALVADQGSVMYSVQRASPKLLSLHGSLHRLKQRASQTWLNRMHVELGAFQKRFASRRRELHDSAVQAILLDGFAEVSTMHMQQMTRLCPWNLQCVRRRGPHEPLRTSHGCREQTSRRESECLALAPELFRGILC